MDKEQKAMFSDMGNKRHTFITAHLKYFRIANKRKR